MFVCCVCVCESVVRLVACVCTFCSCEIDNFRVAHSHDMYSCMNKNFEVVCMCNVPWGCRHIRSMFTSHPLSPTVRVLCAKKDTSLSPETAKVDNWSDSW